MVLAKLMILTHFVPELSKSLAVYHVCSLEESVFESFMSTLFLCQPLIQGGLETALNLENTRNALELFSNGQKVLKSLEFSWRQLNIQRKWIKS